MNVWDQLLEGSQGQAANTQLVSFVARHYYKVPNRAKTNFLDIGPGRHAVNQIYFEARGFNVISVDPSQRALKNMQADICEVEFETNYFDFIYDVNTMCHIEKPPMESICRWLKPAGRFFSIAPTDDTWRGVGEGKSFTRYATLETIENMHDCFTGLRCSRLSYPHGDNQINSWVIEAMK
jgi:SAM-dependent methyltransferase